MEIQYDNVSRGFYCRAIILQAVAAAPSAVLASLMQQNIFGARFDGPLDFFLSHFVRFSTVKNTLFRSCQHLWWSLGFYLGEAWTHGQWKLTWWNLILWRRDATQSCSCSIFAEQIMPLSLIMAGNFCKHVGGIYQWQSRWRWTELEQVICKRLTFWIFKWICCSTFTSTLQHQLLGLHELTSDLCFMA